MLLEPSYGILANLILNRATLVERGALHLHHRDTVVNNSPAMQETWFDPWIGKTFPTGGNGKPLQYSCLGNPMDRGGPVDCSPSGNKESDTTEHTLTSNPY